MKLFRKVFSLSRRYSPIVLAREALLRLGKRGRAVHLRAAIRRGETRLSFRAVPYFRPDLKVVGSVGAAAIINFAELICLGRFPFLGYETSDLGFPPSWNADFISGFAWEQLPAAQVEPVVRHNGSDVKVPWELSRLQFLPVLAKAHLLTGDDKYREAAKALFSDWNARNPVGVGVNWTLAMESALRGMSLCFLLSLLQPLRPDEQTWAAEITLSIWQHLLYTESCVEFSHLIRSNHYLSNIVGLYCMATFLDGPGMERRRREYRRKVEQEILLQVYEDGGDFEASFGYHLLVLQMFVSSYLLMRADGHLATPRFTSRLEAMFRFLAALADGDGRVPHVGDCDDGRVELLTSDLHQMVSLPCEKRDSLLIPGFLSLGNALFHLGCGGDPSDSAWYGLHPEEKRVNRKALTLFPQSGVAVARLGEAEVVFCAIPNGIRGNGSHTHNDKLSVVARIGGVELFCDSGTACYTRDIKMRNLHRSTAAHNTVTVDAREQNEIDPAREFAFRLANQATVSPIEAVESGNEVCLAASHSGLSRIGVYHYRTVRVGPHSISIEDTLSGTGDHSFEIFWHLPAIWRVEKEEGCRFVIAGPFAVSLVVDSNCILDCSHQPASISRTYGGASEKGTRLKIAGRTSFPCTCTTTIAW